MSSMTTRVRIPAAEGDAEVDEHAPRDLTDRDRNGGSLQAKNPGAAQ